MKNKKISIMVLTIGTIFASLIGATYAYIRNTNSNANSVSSTVVTGNVNLTFNDKTSESGTITNGQLIPNGTPIVKHFTTTNSGGPTNINLLFYELKNTFVEGSLKYTLKSGTTEGIYSNTIVNNESVPRSESITNTILKENLTVPGGTTYYELTLTYELLNDIDQTDDLTASFSTGFFAEAPGSCMSNVGVVYVDTSEVGETVFSPECEGKYKLEVWGAQGGRNQNTGGYGGYSVGVVNLNDNESIYINVGGAGQACASTACAGGYNGGGEGYSQVGTTSGYTSGSASGGGATHIATISGTLSSLSSYKGTLANNSYYVSNEILIVAGGGPGLGWQEGSCYAYGNGGYGGGYKSVAASYDACNTGTGQTGITTQTEGFAFGQGGKWSDSTYGGNGGGGGFFGGSGSNRAFYAGAGGSGYIASSRLISSNGIEKAMYCLDCETSADTETKTYQSNTHCTNGYSSSALEKCAKAGNGHARITYLGK